VDLVNARHILLELLDAALRALDGRSLVSRALAARHLPAPVHVIAVGKAASRMALGAIDALGPRLRGAWVATKDHHVDPELAKHPLVRVLECAHPVPDTRSLAAGAELVALLGTLPAEVHPLFLVSGGASSLVEALRDGVTLDDLRTLNQRGLAAGWPIDQLNAERGKLSLVKAGGVANLLAGRAATALFISDVPGDDWDVIGSGLLGRTARRADAIERAVLANAETAVAAVVEAGAAHGLTFERGAARFDGDAGVVARGFVAALRAAHADGVVWGGESTVTLPPAPGRGGRNTHLALIAARELAGDPRCVLLAAGTDGTDGPTSDAGALVDGETQTRAQLGGCDVERALANADSGFALEVAGDLVHTGPTGTNVGDLLIGIKQAPAAPHGHPRVRVL
jgi:glycerate 2-kinase